MRVLLVRCLVSGAFVQYALGASALTFGIRDVIKAHEMLTLISIA